MILWHKTLLPLLVLVTSSLSNQPTVCASDAAWYDQAPWIDGLDFSRTPKPSSQYLTMPDGTKLAVSIYLPRDRTPQQRFPALLLQTRYWRGGGEAAFYAAAMVPRGFAFVAVDVRGTGASFGTRRYTLAPEEVADSKSILDWIVAQPWSDGKIATAGGSYTGATAVTTLSHAHPAHVAAIPGQIAFDLFENGLFPGGVYCKKVFRIWQQLVVGLDNNESAVGLHGLIPVDADSDRSLLTAALAEHAGNFRIHDVVAGAQFRDDVRTDALGEPMQVGDITLHKYAPATAKSEAALLNISGWFDGALLMGPIHRHLRYPSEKSRLVLGPWDHRGHYVSPWRSRRGEGFTGSRSARSDFDAMAHSLRFLTKTVLEDKADEDAPVYYFTMGEERWKSATKWPPPGAQSKTLYFSESGTLADTVPEASLAADQYKVDFKATTGFDTRWASIVNLQDYDIVYSNREKQQVRLLTYTSPPLSEDVEVTGHSRVELYLSATTTDAVVHVYLEDFGGPDDIHYVTEGVLRASHRKTADAPYPSPVVYHSHLQKDHRPLVPGEVVHLTIDLYPTSYVFKKGRCIRIGIAGADAISFARVPSDGTVPILEIQRDREHASHVVLPVMATQN